MFNKIIISTILIGALASTAWGLRVPYPPTLSSPITDDQLSTLNKNMKDMWDMQSGRFELDIVTTTKTRARNGEIWILLSGGTYYLQVKAGDAVRSVALTP